MADTSAMTLIETKTLASAAASIEFTSIPQTFTDLYVLHSTRTLRPSESIDALYIRLNGSTANFTSRYIQGAGSGTPDSGTETRFAGYGTGPTATANTFGSGSIYFPNYTSSVAKSFSVDAVTENNATTAIQLLVAVSWNDTSAITSLLLESATSSNLVAGSTISLYGITKGSDGIVTTS